MSSFTKSLYLPHTGYENTHNLPTDGQLILAELDVELVTEQGYEYYGEPVVLYSYGNKCKTVFDARVVYPGDIVKWWYLVKEVQR